MREKDKTLHIVDLGRVAMAAVLAATLIGCGAQQQASDQAPSTSESEEATSAVATSPVERSVVRITATPSSDNALVKEFAQPANAYKPLTRWWVPGSMMDKDEVKHEIESMVEAGFGGAEVVPVSIAGGDGEGEIDWGTPEWVDITKYMLEVAGQNDFTIDFTMTPAWPLALPGITDGLFTLRCKEEARDRVRQSGLDLDVLDRGTGQWRDVSTLSGGESFLASLALALGLSDIVQAQSGAIRMDAMFIDEGFGTLDDNALRNSLQVLADLADGKRLIGIISHVHDLEERIEKQIVVSKTLKGSKIDLLA